MQNINEIDDLIKLISKLPGLGPKSAKRIVLKLINNRDELIKPMANSLAQVYKNIKRCNFCGSLKSNSNGCPNCENTKDKFNKILEKAKQLETKMKESQENIKKMRVEGISGSNSVKVVLDGNGEMQKIEISDEILKEDKSIVEDLIVAAHNNAKVQLKNKTTEEISKATGDFGRPGFKWPL